MSDITDSKGNSLVLDKFYIIEKKNLQYKGPSDDGKLMFQKNSRGETVNIDPSGKEIVLSYKQAFEPDYASIQNKRSTDYDEDLVEFGGGKRRNKSRRNKSRKSRRTRKSRKSRKSRRHKKTRR